MVCRVLSVMLDENEFLSTHGFRAISRRHYEEPYLLHVNGSQHSVQYEPAGSSTGLFGAIQTGGAPSGFR